MDSLTPLQNILILVSNWSGCDFSRYNPNSMTRRIQRRMIETRSGNMEEYLQQLMEEPQERRALVSTLVIKVTDFFRDQPVFDLLAQQILPDLFALKRQRRLHSLRCWSSACAGGEELYSLAMLVAEELRKQPMEDEPWGITLLGTDVDRKSISLARRGRFSLQMMAGVPESFQRRYFLQPASLVLDSMQVAPALRSLCSFAVFDLSSAPTLAPPGSIFAEYDLILCRNMLIYCQLSLKIEILQRLHHCLRPGGCLVLGKAESLPAELNNSYVSVDRSLKVYRKKG